MISKILAGKDALRIWVKVALASSMLALLSNTGFFEVENTCNFRSIWKNCYVQARVHGNFTEGEAINIYTMVINNLKCSGDGNSIISHELRYFEQPICIKMENMNKSDGNR